MPEISIDHIRPGDTVRYQYQDAGMKAAGIVPKESAGQVYTIDRPGHIRPVHIPCVDGYALGGADLTILEHIPARPDWADALVIRAKGIGYSNEHLVRDCFGQFVSVGNSRFNPVELVNAGHEITIVLDADGNPPTPDDAVADFNRARAAAAHDVIVELKAEIKTLDRVCNEQARELDELRQAVVELKPEPEWLDADALDKLPRRALVAPRHGGSPRHRGRDGRWRHVAYGEDSASVSSSSLDPARLLWIPEADRCSGPITVVLDADGNPPTPDPGPRLHSVDADVAWAHYRKTYAPNPKHLGAAHKAFHAGWDMATSWNDREGGSSWIDKL